MTTPTLGRGALRRAACLVLALGAAAAPVHAAAPPPLDADFARLLAEEQLAGLVYATIDGDATQVGAVGLADVARAEPMRAEHRVLLGSVAKTVTALGVLTTSACAISSARATRRASRSRRRWTAISGCCACAPNPAACFPTRTPASISPAW